MATLPASTQEMTPGADTSAADRIMRMFGRFIGAGYVFYVLVSIPAIVQTASITRPWWTPVALVLFFGPGLALAVVAFVGSIRAITMLAVACMVGYLVGLATWPLGWTGASFVESEPVWFSFFPALAALGAAITTTPARVFLYLAVVTVGAQTVNYTVREPVDRSPLVPDVVYGFGFGIIFVGAAVMAARTGRLLDRTRASSYAQAARSATLEARSVERRRFDGLIHDGVMSTLLAASRPDAGDAVARQARTTLAELDALRDDAGSADDFSGDDVLAHLRAAATAVDGSIPMTVHASDAAVTRYPAEAIRTVGAALAEAVRNSVRHAGEARREVEVTVAADEVHVVVRDDGIGFDTDSVPAHRLGVRVSIVDRMARLSGGSAELRSAPGAGTRVDLWWRR
ncbi:sensor histidine kinase [Rhodococcoides corynebacterioides]|uniref:sensor histidine kinase n=1 Tax=Rhodococcoides corynebacterioides TaxID=53972 RepID=UPI0008373389|nr:ATP-binding protein [Rhodococcus corynebacterioides]